MSKHESTPLPSRPTTQTIMGKKFKINYVKDVDGDGSYGLMDGPNRTILVRADLKPEHIEDTLLHETVHAIMYLSGLSQLFNEDLEEAITLALENGLSTLYLRRVDKKTQEK